MGCQLERLRRGDEVSCRLSLACIRVLCAGSILVVPGLMRPVFFSMTMPPVMASRAVPGPLCVRIIFAMPPLPVAALLVLVPLTMSMARICRVMVAATMVVSMMSFAVLVPVSVVSSPVAVAAVLSTFVPFVVPVTPA